MATIQLNDEFVSRGLNALENLRAMRDELKAKDEELKAKEAAFINELINSIDIPDIEGSQTFVCNGKMFAVKRMAKLKINDEKLNAYTGVIPEGVLTEKITLSVSKRIYDNLPDSNPFVISGCVERKYDDPQIIIKEK